MESNLFLKLTDTEQENLLNYCISEAYKSNGKQGGAESNIIEAMKKIIAKYFPKIYASTVVSCFEKGSLGMLGEFYGLTTKTFTQWLSAGYNGEHHQRDFDIEQPCRPDTEQDQINLLSLLAKRLAGGLDLYADWRREFNYLVIRHQFGVDKYLDFLDAAKSQVSIEAMREKPPVLQTSKNGIITAAMKIAVIQWLEQHPNPCDALSQYIDEKSYRIFRTEF